MDMQKVSSKRLLYKGKECSLSYKNGKLFYKTEYSEQSIAIGGFLNKVKLIERAMRLEPRCTEKIDDRHFIISFNGKILNYDVKDNQVRIEHYYAKGMKNPLNFFGINRNEKREIYFGEYIWNGNKDKAVSIFKRKEDEWVEVYCFPERSITHVHNLVEDKYRNGIIILTGDDDEGSGLWFSDYEFKNVTPILIGSQQYRSCVAFPTKEGIYYATDTPLEQNFVYFVLLDENKKVKSIEKKYKMPGPCIYGMEFNNLMYFATSVEPDSSLPEWRYRLTYRLGDGIKNRYTYVIEGDRYREFREIFKIKKDSFPIWLFQFGNVLFPKNESNTFFAVLQSTTKGHGVTVSK